MSDFPKKQFPISKTVQVCQNRTCKKQGATAVLAKFHALSIPNVTVTASGCLGRCGNGPIVLILPDIIWCSRVQPQLIPQLIEKYL